MVTERSPRRKASGDIESRKREREAAMKSRKLRE